MRASETRVVKGASMLNKNCRQAIRNSQFSDSLRQQDNRDVRESECKRPPGLKENEDKKKRAQ